MTAWSVEPYSIQRLRQLLDDPSPSNRSAETVHDAYFEEYFKTIGARSIVVEREYIDHDFLEDYAAYYVRCFHHYERTCTRLHFFRAAVQSGDIDQVLAGPSAADNKLSSNYLGFIVVRPVPQRPVGRTCLVTYEETGGRTYTSLRACDANLFGLPLSVRSLAFQQQDKAVAACATSALWAAFQASGKLFGHRIPSPAEITEMATRRIPLDTRTLPASSGLTPEQMADAIRACELEPVLLGCGHARDLRAAVHGYAAAGIPLVLVGVIEGGRKPYPRHAVTITGYRLEGAARFEDLVSDRITKLYAHDDAVGPFARMDFLAGDDSLLTTSLADTKHDIGTRRFRPELALVPVYHKIRVPFDRVLGELASFDLFIAGLRDAGMEISRRLPPYHWDLRLRTVNAYKQELRSSASASSMKSVLERPLPRFLWVASARHKTGTGFDLLFDATGIESDNLCVLRVDRQSSLPKVLQAAGLGQDQFSGFEGLARTMLS